MKKVVCLITSSYRRDSKMTTTQTTHPQQIKTSQSFIKTKVLDTHLYWKTTPDSVNTHLWMMWQLLYPKCPTLLQCHLVFYELATIVLPATAAAAIMEPTILDNPMTSMYSLLDLARWIVLLPPRQEDPSSTWTTTAWCLRHPTRQSFQIQHLH